MTDTMQNHDDGLSPAARTALAALRAEDELADPVRDRVWSRLAAAADADDPPDMSRGAAAKVVPLRRRGVLVGLAIAAGLTLTLLGVQRAAQPVARATRGEAAAHAGAATPEREARAPRAAQDPATTAITASPTPVPEDSSVTAHDEAQPGPTARRTLSDRAPVLEDSPNASALAAEAALMQRAQTALAADDAATALGLLELHAAEHPDGVLTPERAALRVLALCAAGREVEGRAEAASFLRAHAGTVLAGRVRGACEPD